MKLDMKYTITTITAICGIVISLFIYYDAKQENTNKDQYARLENLMEKNNTMISKRMDKLEDKIDKIIFGGTLLGRN